MTNTAWRVCEVAMLAALMSSGPTYAQRDSPNGDPGQDRQEMRQGRRDVRQDRQDLQGDRRDRRRTTERCEQTVRRCGRTASNPGRMNMLEPARDNSNRTGNRCGTTVRISEETDRIGIKIGRTCAPTGSSKDHTGKGFVAALNNGQAPVDRARFVMRQGQKMREVGDRIPHRAVPSTYSAEIMCTSVPSPSTVPLNQSADRIPHALT